MLRVCCWYPSPLILRKVFILGDLALYFSANVRIFR